MSSSPQQQRWNLGTYSEEGVQRSVLHELRDDHDRTALGDHALQVNNVGMVELAHDAGLAEEVTPLLLRVARLQRFYGHKHLPFPWELEIATANFPKLSCGGVTAKIATVLQTPKQLKGHFMN